MDIQNVSPLIPLLAPSDAENLFTVYVSVHTLCWIVDPLSSFLFFFFHLQVSLSEKFYSGRGCPLLKTVHGIISGALEVEASNNQV